MSKKMKIGPYSAYAIAVKYGYTGTEEQWVKEQEASRVASEQAAQQAEAARDNAETAATRAETAQRQTEEVRTDALDKIDSAKTDALEAVAAKQTSATAAVDTAKASALNDVEAAKSAAVKTVTDTQSTATQAVDAARDKAVEQVNAATEAAKTAASEASTSAGNASQSAQQAAGSLQELKDGIASGNFKGEKGDRGEKGDTGPQGPKGETGPAVALDTTLTHEGEAADAKATGDAISAVKARQNILVGTETGNPIAVNDAFSAPLCGLTVYGKSTQDGTPTPDAPVPIVSAGDDGSVAVKVTGKNLLDSALMNSAISSRGISAKQNSDGSYTISGTPIADDTIPIWLCGNWSNTVPLFTIPPGSYYSNVWIYYYDGKTRTSKKGAFTLSEPFRITGVMYSQPCAINERCDFLLAPQLELGTTATAYSPYRKQLLTLPTPNGLPGIPVTSGGNYTDQNGQQWVCDEVDLERGMKVQRVNAVDLSTCRVTAITKFTVTKRLSIQLPLYGRDYKTEALCNKLPFKVSFDKDVLHFYVDKTNVQIFIPLDAKTPEEGEYILFYALATPIETPLTPDKIAAYKALVAYGPDTVVQASDGAGVKLGYQRDVNIAIKRIEDAIASMT